MALFEYNVAMSRQVTRVKGFSTTSPDVKAEMWLAKESNAGKK